MLSASALSTCRLLLQMTGILDDSVRGEATGRDRTVRIGRVRADRLMTRPELVVIGAIIVALLLVILWVSSWIGQLAEPRPRGVSGRGRGPPMAASGRMGGLAASAKLVAEAVPDFANTLCSNGDHPIARRLELARGYPLLASAITRCRANTESGATAAPL
jgi:hypothetical protein